MLKFCFGFFLKYYNGLETVIYPDHLIKVKRIVYSHICLNIKIHGF